MKKLLFAVALIALTVAGCGTDESPAQSESKTPSTPKPTEPATPKEDPAAWAKKVRATAIEMNLGKPIRNGCHLPKYTWQCFFDHVEGAYVGRLDVHLGFPGDVLEFEADEMAEDARKWWMNMAGLDHPELELVVSFNDGVDSGTSYRRDFAMLN